MRIIENYVSPTPADLQALKTRLSVSSQDIADLVCLGQGSQWRKYTGGTSPRTMSPHMLFFLAAQLALTDDEIARVFAQMRAIGGKFETGQHKLRENGPPTEVRGLLEPSPESRAAAAATPPSGVAPPVEDEEPSGE